MTTQTQQPEVLVQEAAHLFKELGILISAENDAIESNDFDFVEQKVREKTRLAVKLEHIISQMKLQRAQMTDSAKAKAQVLHAELEAFQEDARKNLMTLRAAHQTRADFLGIVRRLVDEKRPQARTYNSGGSMSNSAAQSSLINKSI